MLHSKIYTSLSNTLTLEHTGTTAKDLNWTNAKRKIRLGTKMGNLLLDQLERDAKLLMENEILDYSLLLGVIRSDDAAVHASQWNKKSDDDDDDDVDRRLRSRWSLYHGGICGRRVEKDNDEKVEENSTSAQIQEGHKILSKEFHVDHLDRDDPFRVYLETEKENKEEDTEFEIYYIGIIDILQDWTGFKFVEHNVKAVTGLNSADMSAVRPEVYYPRFVKFMRDKVVEHEEEEEE